MPDADELLVDDYADDIDEEYYDEEIDARYDLIYMISKICSWVIGFVIPALLIWAGLDKMLHGGFVGVVALVVSIPAGILGALILKAILRPVLLTLLTKQYTPLMNVVRGFCGVILLGMIIATIVGYRYLAHTPIEAVQARVDMTPQLTQVFTQNKAELERRRTTNDYYGYSYTGIELDGAAFLVDDYYTGEEEVSGGSVYVFYVYSEEGAPDTGYDGVSVYRHKLDDNWYIHIELSSSLA